MKSKIIIAAIVLVVIVIAIAVSSDKQKEESSVNASAVPDVAVAPAQSAAPSPSLPDLLRSKISDYSKGIAPSVYQSGEARILLGELRKLADAADYVEHAEQTEDKESKQEAAKLKKKLTSVQNSELPKLRKAYAAGARELIWREDIDVKVGGSGNNTITFIGANFASNSNIEDFQNTINEILHAFRFKKAAYKWYAGADGWEYTLKSKKDGELFEHSDIP